MLREDSDPFRMHEVGRGIGKSWGGEVFQKEL
jgi:hypothetical protein